MVGLATLVGIAVASPHSIFGFESVLCFLTGFFISSYSMILNDYYDLESDVLSAPSRVLPSGRMSPRRAIHLSLVMLSLGLVSAGLLGLGNLLIAGIFSFLSWLYSHSAKKAGLLGNFIVSLSVAIPYVYGAVAVGRGMDEFVWLLSATSFLACLGREVIKTIPDVKGDEVRGVRSVARVHGPEFAARLGALFFVLAVASSLLPVALGLSGLAYTISILPVDAYFLYLSYRIARNFEEALEVKRLALFGMLAGIFAFTLGGIFR